MPDANIGVKAEWVQYPEGFGTWIFKITRTGGDGKDEVMYLTSAQAQVVQNAKKPEDKV